MCLLRVLFVCLALSEAGEISSESTGTVGSGVCLAGSGICLSDAGSLLPKDLPTFEPFSDWGPANKTVDLPGGPQEVAEGVVKQQGFTDETSSFAVLPKVVRKKEVKKMLALLRDAGLRFDDDPDTVDAMPTHEFWVDSHDIQKGQPPKQGLNSPGIEEVQKPVRKKMQKIVKKIVNERITPYVRQRYPEACNREAEGRVCRPCYSLIRRYRKEDRRSHAIHHDGHAFVTVVVSLTTFGKDYAGGLYVASSNSKRQYVALERGDAVVHKSDLYHGVQVLEQENKTTGRKKLERWSWIMWFRDSGTCEDHSKEWFAKCAEEGNPTCEALHSTKAGGEEQVLYWNMRASQHGHSVATMKLARAFMKWLPSSLPQNVSMARHLFEQAVIHADEPEAHYGLAQMMITKDANASTLRQAVAHLEAASKHRHPFAMYNLGMAHLFGYGTASGVNHDHAGAWFEACGLPEGAYAKSLHSRHIGREDEALRFEGIAKSLGFGAPWRQEARDRLGMGGAGGIALNLDWPVLPNGQEPPKL